MVRHGQGWERFLNIMIVLAICAAVFAWVNSIASIHWPPIRTDSIHLDSPAPPLEPLP